jgi:hypothetical protein
LEHVAQLDPPGEDLRLGEKIVRSVEKRFQVLAVDELKDQV